MIASVLELGKVPETRARVEEGFVRPIRELILTSDVWMIDVMA